MLLSETEWAHVVWHHLFFAFLTLNYRYFFPWQQIEANWYPFIYRHNPKKITRWKPAFFPQTGRVQVYKTVQCAFIHSSSCWRCAQVDPPHVPHFTHPTTNGRRKKLTDVDPMCSEVSGGGRGGPWTLPLPPHSSLPFVFFLSCSSASIIENYP